MSVFRLGLTGSIGMGKSTTAALFAAEGIPVWDADAAVHRLYSVGGAAVRSVGGLCPAALHDSHINRAALRDWIATDPSALARLEAVVHPLVAADCEAFVAQCTGGIAVFDIPLLFEKGTEAQMDATLLVTAPKVLQRQRVLARPGMTEHQFALLLSRQMPDAEKRARATHIVETLSIHQTRAYVQALIGHLRDSHA
ncbi:dephospho-CoA kinase [Pseudotabrizicola sediminis]|uniref:Dephospho-CoA kinase n=1 Tax=Pseudotabrizicola sediminis TaxID=2486418 RepID=A0ABY2KL61_9RHOB|nr:dephospho-CoA kinase [Pseudotabrizicola sediminis]TGD43255.1 dephospho-CoA kinase [Pseudotabrizicola sediminis]